MSASYDNFKEIGSTHRDDPAPQLSILVIAAFAISFAWYFGSLASAEMAMNTNALAVQLMAEDHVIEMAQALSYAAALIFCFTALMARKHALLAAVWTILCLLCLGEEISWGQRILGFSAPAMEAYNAHGDFTLHEISSVAIGETVGLFNAQALFQIGFYAYFFVVPAMMLNPAFAQKVTQMGYIRPSLPLMFFGLMPILASYLVYFLMQEEFFRNAVVEGRETAFAGIIAIYLYQTLIQRDRNEA